MSSMQRRNSGSRWPSTGAAIAFNTRSSTGLGPGPSSTRFGGSNFSYVTLRVSFAMIDSFLIDNFYAQVCRLIDQLKSRADRRAQCDVLRAADARCQNADHFAFAIERRAAAVAVI